jgi:hypothetical protein
MGRVSSRAGYRLGDAGRRGPRWSVALAEMVHDTLDDRRVGEEADNSHFASISGTHQRIYLVHSPDQLGPAASRRCALWRRRDRLLNLG